MRTKLSAIIITRNEQSNIRRCLISLDWVDEIIVVDQASTDNTVNICKEFTDKIFVVSSKGFCEPDRPVAVSKAKNEWILYIDADEEVSGELKVEIQVLLTESPRYDSYYIARKNIFLGKWIKGSGWHPAYVLRLFRKGFVKFPEDIHADITPLANCGYLKKPIIHYTCQNLEDYINKVNRYTSVLAKQAYSKGKRINSKNFILKLFILPLVYFFYKLIVKMGFRDGLYGFLIAFLTLLTVFLSNVKLWEKQFLNQEKIGR